MITKIYLEIITKLLDALKLCEQEIDRQRKENNRLIEQLNNIDRI